MSESWYFIPLQPGVTIREPIAGAFFASDAVSEPGEALLREGVQNSLDAAPGGQSILVRISLGDEDTPSWSDIRPYVTGAMDHYQSEGNGLLPEQIPSEQGPHRLLVFEDFGTTGLLGDPSASNPPTDGSKNNFLHFYRAEGLTDKDPGQRGSWGVGKDTFFRASMANTVFGLTVRADDSRHLLMGKTVLKSHLVGQDRFQEGFYGVQDAAVPTMVLPIERPDTISRFRDVFRIERQDEPGLSVVVPWPDPDINEETLMRATFKNYFYPILSGSLSVMVETAGVQAVLNSSNFLEEARRLEDQDNIIPIVELAEWAINGDAAAHRHVLEMSPPDRRWTWQPSLFPENMLSALATKWRQQEPIAIRVPVTVRKKGGVINDSYFDVYIQSANAGRLQRPTFVRDGIVISDVAAPRRRDVRALVVVEDESMSEFLRDAENPSHTVWQSQQVKRKYESGVGDLQFVVRSVSSILDLLSSHDREVDKRLLSDYFPVPKRPGDRPGGNGVPRRRQIAIGQIAGGFSVTAGDAHVTAGDTIEVTAAYNVRRGSAFSRYSERDFHFGDPAIEYTCDGATVRSASENRIVIDVLDPEFRIAARGFDQNRDLIVRATHRSVSDADTPN